MFKASVQEARYNRRRFTWELVRRDVGLWPCEWAKHFEFDRSS
jgi:hypothetical protein